MAATPTYPKDVKNIAKTIAPADSTNWVDLYDNSAGLKSARVEALAACSTDTATVNIQIGLLKGGTTFLMGTVAVVTLSGTNGTALRVNLMSSLGTTDPDGIATIEVEAGAKLQARTIAAVTAATLVTLTGRARTYEA